MKLFELLVQPIVPLKLRLLDCRAQLRSDLLPEGAYQPAGLALKAYRKCGGVRLLLLKSSERQQAGHMRVRLAYQRNDNQ